MKLPITVLLAAVASASSLAIGDGMTVHHHPETKNASNTEIEVFEQNHGTLLGWTPPIYYMNQYDSMTLKLSSGALRVAPWASGYPPGYSNSRITITYKPFWPRNFVITFRTMDLYSRTRRTCVRSRLDLYDGHGTVDVISEKSGLCGNHVGREDYVTFSSALTMTFKTEGLPPHTYQFFEAIITPFHTGTCSSGEVRCRNGRCISDELYCDGYNNCGDNSDEVSCDGKLILSIGAIVGIVIGCVIVVGIIIALVICRCCCYAFEYTRL